MTTKNPPATRFKYAPNLVAGDLVLLMQGNYVNPAVFVKDVVGNTVHTYSLNQWTVERIRDYRTPYCNYITGSSTGERVIKIDISVLDTLQKEWYTEIKEFIETRNKKAEEKEQKKALKKVSTKKGIIPGDVVIVNTSGKGITVGKDYFTQMVDKKHRQIMLVDDSGFPVWHKTKHFVKREKVNDEEFA